MMKKVILDFSNCKNWNDMHQLVMKELDFPDYYGKNLDALWDCLSGWIETPVAIEIRGMASLPADLHDLGAHFLRIFRRAEATNYLKIRLIVKD